jgi:hypothetical protein
MANFAVVSGTNAASATIVEENFDSVAVVGELYYAQGFWK